MSKELTSIRISKDTVEILKNLEVALWWVELLSHDDKIKHLNLIENENLTGDYCE